MKVLTHYSSALLNMLERFSTRPDNSHSPGGLWLSDDSDYGWWQFLRFAARTSPSEWADASETWKFKTDFEVDTDRLLWIKTEDGMHQFVSDYGEPQQRACDDDPSGHGNGMHIEWTMVKAMYKGILISPCQQQLSHRHRDAKFHWYRFDCASACVWDLSILKPPPHITIVDTRTSHRPRQPRVKL